MKFIQLQAGLAIIKHNDRYSYLLIDNSHIIIAAASATFNDSLTHCIGIWSIWSTSSKLSSSTPVFSFHIISASGSSYPNKRSYIGSAVGVFSAATRRYHCSRHHTLASLGFRKDPTITSFSAHSAVFPTFSSSSGRGVNPESTTFRHNPSQVRNITHVL
jgi:hypothetical protein